jgi:putative toxin-antitoxin system antitoxin component (TIGR02293 family)
MTGGTDPFEEPVEPLHRLTVGLSTVSLRLNSMERIQSITRQIEYEFFVKKQNPRRYGNNQKDKKAKFKRFLSDAKIQTKNYADSKGGRPKNFLLRTSKFFGIPLNFIYSHDDKAMPKSRDKLMDRSSGTKGACRFDSSTLDAPPPSGSGDPPADRDAFLNFLEEVAATTTDQGPAELEALGGAHGVGWTVTTPNDLLRAVESGFRASAIDALVTAGILQSEIEALIAPLRTLQRRRRDGRLSREESDAALRLARILNHAEMTLGSRERALGWLRRPNRTFGDAAPMTLLATEAGGRRIEDQLLRADYGLMA